MNESHILLICILWILFLIIFNELFGTFYNYLSSTTIKERINNDLPDNAITAAGDANLLIPTGDQTYNPHDTNRPQNNASHQTTSNLNNNLNLNTDFVDTSMDIPIVYSFDEIKDTTVVSVTPSIFNPSISPLIDTGSGTIKKDIHENNQILNKFNSIN